VPKLCFAELELAELASDPRRGRAEDLPYPQIDHLRNCFVGLEDAEGKHTKTVDRIHPRDFPYRSVKSGFFLGTATGSSITRSRRAPTSPESTISGVAQAYQPSAISLQRRTIVGFDNGDVKLQMRHANRGVS